MDRARRPPTAAWGLAWAALAALSLTVSRPFIGILVDDAYITFRQATRLTHGSFSFNSSESIAASSSTLQVLLLAGLARIGLSPERAVVLVGIVAILVVCAALTIQVHRHAPAVAPWDAVALPAVVLSGTSMSLWWFYGLETPIWTAIVLIAAIGVEAWAWSDDTTYAPITIVMVCLAAIVRPEGGLIMIAWTATLVVLCPGARRRLLTLLAFAVASTASVGLLNLALYGLWFPAPVYLKTPQTHFLATIHVGLYYARRAFDVPPLGINEWAVAAWAVVAAAYWLPPPRAFWNPQRLSRALPAATLACLIGGMAITVGGDWMPFGRLLVPTFPLIAAAIVAAGLPGALRIAPRLAAAAAVVTGLLLHPAEANSGLLALGHASSDTCGARIAERLRHDGRPDEVLAASDIGQVGYAFDGDVLDYFGLVNPRLSRSGRGAGAATVEDVIGNRPAWVIAYASERVTATEWRTDGLPFAQPIATSLANSPELRADYRIAEQCEGMPGRWYVLLRRSN